VRRLAEGLLAIAARIGGDERAGTRRRKIDNLNATKPTLVMVGLGSIPEFLRRRCTYKNEYRRAPS
jgi:hypothetical protein